MSDQPPLRFLARPVVAIGKALTPDSQEQGMAGGLQVIGVGFAGLVVLIGLGIWALVAWGSD